MYHNSSPDKRVTLMGILSYKYSGTWFWFLRFTLGSKWINWPPNISWTFNTSCLVVNCVRCSVEGKWEKRNRHHWISILMCTRNITKLLFIFPQTRYNSFSCSQCIFIRLYKGDLESSHQLRRIHDEVRGLVGMPFPNPNTAEILFSSPVFAQIPVQLPIPVKM